METLKINISLFTVGIVLLGLTAGLQAQDRTAAVEAFNKAQDLAKQENYEEAISAYNQALANAAALGEEGQDIVERIENRLPTVHFRRAAQIYQSNQPLNTAEKFDEVISAFNEAADVGEEYGDQQIITRAEDIVTRMTYNKGVMYFRNQNWQESLTLLNEAISRDSSYAAAYYQKALVFKNQTGSYSLEEIMGAYDRAIEVAEQQGNNDIVTSANESAAAFLTTRGATLNEQQQHQEAVEILNRALEYDDTLAEAYYRLSVAHNQLAQYNQALTQAQQALEYDTGGRADLARIYYEIGTAYKNLGNTGEACSAFAQAAYGDFTDPARHQMQEELECETETDS